MFRIFMVMSFLVAPVGACRRDSPSTNSAGSLTTEQIEMAIAPHREKIDACYAAELKRRPDLKGVLTVKLLVGVDGAVQEAGFQSDGSTLNDLGVRACVLQTVVQIPFPKPSGGELALVRHTFTFPMKGP